MQIFMLSTLRVAPPSKPDLDAVVSNWYILIMLAPWTLLLIPERFSAMTNQWAGNATEFLLTRATDRNILYRSKAALLYLIVLVVFGVLFLSFLKRPDQLLYLNPFKFPNLLKSRMPILWRLLIISIWALLIIRFGDAFFDMLDFGNNRLFFSFAAHQAGFWIFAALVLILGQLWCERRFARLEQ